MSPGIANITWPVAALTGAGLALQWLPESVLPRLQARFVARGAGAKQIRRARRAGQFHSADLLPP